MSLKQKISEDTRNAMRVSNPLKLSVLRMALSAVNNKEIELGKKDEGLSDEEIIEVLKTEAKKRKDAAQEYRKGGREDSAKKEEQELKIIEEYLPEQMSDEEIEKIVDSVIAETRAETQSDMGRVMSGVMSEVKGNADGSRVSAIVKEKLSGTN